MVGFFLCSNGCQLSFLFPLLRAIMVGDEKKTLVGDVIIWDIYGNMPICNVVLFFI